ncbi:MAG: glycosyltransferase [Bdellovibrio sp.]
MKVVLLHDWLTGYRGGERVLDALCELYPEAPLYTLVHVPGSSSPRIEERKITTSFINQIPGAETNYRKFLPLFPKAAEHLKIVEKADLVLSSSHCVIKGVQKPKGARHISYIHSPMRYLYDQFDTYFGPGTPLAHRLGMKAFRGYLTNWDLHSNRNVDTMIANSSFVAERIRRIYGRPSQIIHPFVDLSDFRTLQGNPPAKQNFDLVLSAFAPNKRIDLAVHAYNESGRSLKIVGSGQLERELKAAAGPNIEFLGNLSRSEVLQQLFEARALIFPGVEDFGITPLEALAAGTPVVAYSKGGVLETLTPEPAEFFDEAAPESLAKALSRLESRSFEISRLHQQAEKFSRTRFLTQMREMIEAEMAFAKSN